MAELPDYQALFTKYHKALKDIEKLLIESKKLNSQIAQLQAKNKALTHELNHLKSLAKTNGTNSGIPTSQTRYNQDKVIPNSRVKTGRKRGGQRGHVKHGLAPFKEDEVTETVVHENHTCPHCQYTELTRTKLNYRDETEIKVIVIKRRHLFYDSVCPHCGRKIKITIPKNLRAPNQYGPNLKAFALSLMNEGNVSINKTQRMITGVSYGQVTPSQGYLAKLQKQTAEKLAPFTEDLRQELLRQKVLYWDDTVIMVNTKRACLRYYGTPKLALYKSHSHKGLDSIKEDQLLTLLPKEVTVMHDHNRVNYNKLFSYGNIECNVHLMRDLQKCFDITKHSWAKDLKHLLIQADLKRNELIDQGIEAFDEVDEKLFYNQIAQLILQGWERNDPQEYGSKQEKTLLKRLLDYRINYFSWISNFDFPFSNNLSERSLRPAKSKMKIAGQFQNVGNAQNYATIRSYIETCYRNGKNPTEALQRLSDDRPYKLTELIQSKAEKA